MKPGSRKLIHVGINYIISPPPVINPQSFLKFQEALVSCSLDFTNSGRQEQQYERRIEITRNTPPLQILIIASTKQPVGQLLIIAPHPARTVEYFIQETEQVVEAFEGTWETPHRQIMKRDITIRDLYEATSDHAFQELWEERLGQSLGSLSSFGPIHGGGLRFVIPPQPNRPAQIEIKIESYLQDSSKIFAETQFTWPMPTEPGVSLDPRNRLLEAEDYAKKQVLSFIMGDTNDINEHANTDRD
jgi:hypothetical protein